MPLWLSRLRSQKLLSSVMRFHDFPILLETWRTCLRDDFDMESLQRNLGELESGMITCSETHTRSPSPMARSATWGQINRYMYLDDSMRSGKASMLRRDFIQDVIFTPALRPAVPERIIEQFELKRKRLIPGYSPETSRELLDWVKERLLIPASEWESLLEMAHADHHIDRSALLGPIAGKVVRLCPPAASEPLLAALELLPNILRGIYPDTGEFPVELLSKAGTIADLEPLEAQEAEDDAGELFISLLGDWLRFYGPVQQSFICATLGRSPDLVRGGIEDLAESEKVIIGRLVRDSDQEFVCESVNFELLLRVARAAARPAFKAIDIQWLPLFLAQHQGITAPATGVEGLFQRIEQLLFYPEAAELWESEIFPARLKSYESEWLDTLMQSGDLSWIGSKGRQVSFYFKSDLLAPTSAPVNREVAQLFPDPRAGYGFSALVHLSGSRPSEVAGRLWNAVWQGHVAVDSFIPLRQGVETEFRIPTPPEGARGKKLRGMGFSRWRNSYPFAGNWQLISNSAPDDDVIEPDDDVIEKEERDKDRVRLLLERYGILFRELLQNESAPFRWASIFRASRLMELSGEILTGYFFHGVPGPQFISHKTLRALQGKLPDDAVYWISAVDPASPCGTALELLKSSLPRRIPGTHLVYHGPKLVLVSQRNGRRLSIHVSHDHDRLKEYWCVLHHLLERKSSPLRRIIVETINDEPAKGSPYLKSLAEEFDLSVDYKRVTLYQKRTLNPT
jgi:ATP-dependent helicase Lhr and Lhr-like helicase